MKKLFLFILTIMLPIVASADDSGSCGTSANYTYVEATHTLTISGSGGIKNYKIESTQHPGAYSWYQAPWSEYKSEIIKLVIEEGITSIGSYAFNGLTNLISLSIPETVTSIGDESFRGCKSICSINLPKGLKRIDHYAFEECEGLTSITIPNSVEFIAARGQVCGRPCHEPVPVAACG